MSQIGAMITKGPAPWQVLQQRGGKVDIALEGVWRMDDGVEGGVLARVVREDTGEPLVPWVQSEDLGGRQWRSVLHDVPQGGLYRVETCFAPKGQLELEWSVRGDMVHHIGVGDLWVIAGQSNSAGYGKDMIYDPAEPGVHVLRNSGCWDLATHPLNESTGTIHEANREYANPGHSPWLSFAKMVHRETGMPIGLLQTSLGGSPLREWLPGGSLYAGMADVIASQGGCIRGVLWYQGCSDTDTEELSRSYLERFTSFVGAVRGLAGDDALPFITVQINRYVAGTNDLSWSIVREAQRQAAKVIPHVFVIPTLDCSLSDTIHISAASNMALGERAARVALANLYGKPCLWAVPDIKCAEMAGDCIRLRFANVHQRLYLLDAPVHKLPFVVEDEAGKVEITAYRVSANDEIELTTARAPRGRCVVHSHFGCDPSGALLLDSAGRLPALAFYGVEVFKA
jgi:sialate O-acetylesterase